MHSQLLCVRCASAETPEPERGVTGEMGRDGVSFLNSIQREDHLGAEPFLDTLQRGDAHDPSGEVEPFPDTLRRGDINPTTSWKRGRRIVKFVIRQGWVDNFAVMPMLTLSDRLERREMMIRAAKRANHHFERIKKKEMKERRARIFEQMTDDWEHN